MHRCIYQCNMDIGQHSASNFAMLLIIHRRLGGDCITLFLRFRGNNSWSAADIDMKLGRPLRVPPMSKVLCSDGVDNLIDCWCRFGQQWTLASEQPTLWSSQLRAGSPERFKPGGDWFMKHADHVRKLWRHNFWACNFVINFWRLVENWMHSQVRCTTE